MIIQAILQENSIAKRISLDIPVISNPMLPVTYSDPRWARPPVFHDFSYYVFAEANDVPKDFQRLVHLVNESSGMNKMDKYKQGLLKLIDEHINIYGRLLFPDLLMFIDCFSYLCYASDLMSEDLIRDNYASWVRYVVCKRKDFIRSSIWGGDEDFIGSKSEVDLLSVE